MEDQFESIIQPSRIDSLESKSIRVIIHSGPKQSSIHTLEDVYMFQPVYTLKQRIMLEMKTKNWATQFIYFAVMDGDVFKPVEFKWDFSDTMKNPYDELGVVNPALYKDDSKMPVEPTLYQGLLLKSVIREDQTIHAWSAVSLFTALGHKELTDATFYGFFRYYFPNFDATAEFMKELKHIDSALPEMMESTQSYFTMTAERFQKLNKALPSLPHNPAQLHKLHMLRFKLPVKRVYASGLLELHFYKMNPTTDAPFIRFFPSIVSLSPLVKIATGAIHKKKVFQAYMADESPIEESEEKIVRYSAILIKSAIVPATDNVCWTLCIYEDGSADLTIGASRSDRPLSLKDVQEAFAILPVFLKNTAWKEGDNLTLTELSAEYMIRVSKEGDQPTTAELNKRYDVLVPLFRKETLQNKPFALRYRAVDNFIVDANPIIEYISFLYLTQSSASIQAVNLDEIRDSVVKEYGISATEAGVYMDVWSSRHSEQIVTEREDVIQKYHTGSRIYLQNDHPEYKAECLNIQSFGDLQVIISLISVFFYNTSVELGYEKADSKAAIESAQEQEQKVQEEQQEQLAEEDEIVYEGLDELLAADESNTPPPAAPAAKKEEEPLPAITKVSEKEFIIKEQVNPYIEKLKARDNELFDSGDYVKACQANANAQPNVMDPLTYTKARRLYGDAVSWVELPLEESDLLAVQIATSQTADERFGSSNMQNKKFELNDLVSFEIRALKLGFPLKKNESVVSSKKKNKEQYKALIEETPDIEDTIKALMDEQQKKPLWTVSRAGTKIKEPDVFRTNYYICAEYWCMREGIPLIPEEFYGTKFRESNGVMKEGKPKDTCPFCAGKLIKKEKKGQYYYYTDDIGGATVLKREPKPNSSQKIAKYVGYLRIAHANKFAQPCCYLTLSYDNLKPGDGAAELPPADSSLLPEIQKKEKLDIVVDADVDDKTIDRRRPFSPKSFDSNAQNTWYIFKQNVLCVRNLEEPDRKHKYCDLKYGAIAALPAEVNTLLGQDTTNFFVKVSTNVFLKSPGAAFIRYGLGATMQNPGSNLLSFLAYANYVIDYMITSDDKLSILTNDKIFEELFEKQEVRSFNAFVQANYGSLVHEFTMPGQTLESIQETELNFQRWKSSHGFVGASQHAFALQAYLAWHNFKLYIQDESTRKDLRYFETLFTCQGLFSKTGFVLVKIKFTKDSKAIVECPKFGISMYSQKIKPGMIFIVEDELTGLFDPVLFYEGTKDEAEKEKDIIRLFGIITPDSPQFGKVQTSIRAVIKSFYDTYYSGQGCARTASAQHPWFDYGTGFPTLSELKSVFQMKQETEQKTTKAKKSAKKPEKVADKEDDDESEKESESENESDSENESGQIQLKDYSSIRQLLRDRSNRLVGVIVKIKPFKTSLDYFIPCIDDGIVLSDIPSVFGEEALPLPPLENVISFLIGKHSKLSKQRIAYYFNGLKPLQLLQSRKTNKLVGVKLKSGAIIPFEPTSPDQKLPLSARTSMQKVQTSFEEFPWEIDVSLLGPTNPDANSTDFTDEEVLNEAYEHMRVSLAAYLQTRGGERLRRQIELLRQARKRLPLYELQKRLDLILGPYVKHSITTDGYASQSILRRDCLQIKKEEDCVGSCTFSDGRCLIHAKDTQRYVDPVRVITARLTDELLRTFRQAEEILKGHVSLLRPMAKGAVVQEGDTALFSAFGRGDSALYSRLGYSDKDLSKFTADLTYPEEYDLHTGDEQAYREKSAPFAADVRRDALARLAVAYSEIAGSDDPLPEGFRGTDADWVKFSRDHDVDIIKTKMGPGNTPVFDKIIHGNYKGAGEHTYGLLDIEGIPVPIVGNDYRVKQRRLPEEIQTWLTTQGVD